MAEERPDLVKQRERLGDWEADTLVEKGHRGALESFVDRKSHFILLRPLGQRLEASVAPTAISLLSPFMNMVHTITRDNGK